MTLDDAITYYDEIAKAYRRKADIESNDYMDMRDHAYETEQLASWLNELKLLRERLDAQPEIIYCRDCKYKDDGIDEDGIPFLKCLNGRSYGGTRINDFCSWAERREE